MDQSLVFPCFRICAALIFFLWEVGGQVKVVVYETHIAPPENLVVRISAATVEDRNISRLFQRVWDSMYSDVKPTLQFPIAHLNMCYK